MSDLIPARKMLLRYPLPSWAVAWSVILLIAITLPFVVGWISAPGDTTFSGVITNPHDTNSYLAVMRRGSAGQWLYDMPLNYEPSTPLPLFLTYFLLGHLAHWTTIPIPLLFHVARVLAAGVLLVVSYAVIDYVLAKSAEKRFAFGLLLFTSGWGALMQVVFGISTTADNLNLIPDIWIGESATFTSLTGNVHFPISMICLIGLISAGDAFVQQGQPLRGGQALAAGLVLFLIHPFQLLIAGLTILLGMARRMAQQRRVLWIEGQRLAVVFVPLAVLTLWLMWQTRADPVLANWTAQKDMNTPPLWSEFFILYGPLLWLALIGCWQVVRSRQTAFYPLVTWFVVVLIVINLPFSFQRRFIVGWHLPVTIFATVGWCRVVKPALRKRVKRRAVNMLQAGLVASVALTPIFIFTSFLATVLLLDNPHTFITPDQADAQTCLAKHAALDDVVMAHLENGNRLPARINVRSMVGHWNLSNRVEDSVNAIEAFYAASTTDAERVALLAEFNVRFVYVSDQERKLGNFAPEDASFLIPICETATVSVFEVDRDQVAASAD